MSDLVSPYPSGVLPAEHQAEVAKIRTCITAWISAANSYRENMPGAEEMMTAATNALLKLDVAVSYAFTQPSPYTFRRILLSCTRCYWLALIASLDEYEKDEMMKRLDCIPPLADRISKFDGTKCVGKPGELSAKEYEGLMRTMHLVALGMVPKDVVKSWYELGEVGVQTWEED